MCGLAGLFDPQRRLAPDARAGAAAAMAAALAHRGPDGEGVFQDDAFGVALAHRRLAIIELSKAADQPMNSPGGRYAVVFNGEIYNYQSIAADLAAVQVHFDARSDTRVLLAAIEHWGLEAALTRCVGMFAFALFDRETGAVHLVRDRFGVKPLAYGRLGSAIAFASELSAIEAAARRLDLRLPPLDPIALSHYVTHGYVAEGTAIYRDFAKVPPGAIVTLGPDGGIAKRDYWRFEDMRRSAAPFSGNLDAAREELEAHLFEAVGSRLVSDVPVGVFLSGGIDSSLVTALMQRRRLLEGGKPARSFTIGFEDMGYNEAPAAHAIADHLGTDHTEVIVGADAALAVVPKLGRLFDEPFADASAIPMLVIAETARRHVTVALSGDGGDEGFGGYARYMMAAGLRHRFGVMPRVLRKALGAGLDLMAADVLDGAIQTSRGALPKSLRRRLTGGRIKGLAQFLKTDDPAFLYASLVRQWGDASDALRRPESQAIAALPEADTIEARMMAADSVGYLPGDILVKVDRTTMAHGLEAREPLLDHRLIEFAWRLPAEMKIKDGKGKRILAGILSKYVPTPLFERPKQGFGVPMHDWLRGPLRGWAEDLLSPAKIDSIGLLNSGRVRHIFEAHMSGRIDRQHQLWNALMLQAWADSRGLG